MPRPHSLQLREQVVSAYLRGGRTETELARLYGIGEASVRRWLRRQRTTGSVAPAPHGGGQPLAVKSEQHEALRETVLANPGRTLAQLVEAFAAKTGIRISLSTMRRTIGRLGLRNAVAAQPAPRPAPMSASDEALPEVFPAMDPSTASGSRTL